jgi:hypothetical protein
MHYIKSLNILIPPIQADGTMTNQVWLSNMLQKQVLSFPGLGSTPAVICAKIQHLGET